MKNSFLQIPLKFTFIFCAFFFTSCDNRDSSKFPVITLSYIEAENEVGGHSTLSDQKLEDVFNSKYKDHWFTWEGVISLVESDHVSINIDGSGLSDLNVYFADEKAGYDLKVGQKIKVCFVMTSPGGSFLSFGGEDAFIVKD